MKLRHICLGYTVGMLAIFFLGILILSGTGYEKRDMVPFYDTKREVEALLSSGEEKENIASGSTERNYEILLCDDENYSIRLNESYQADYLVMDLMAENQMIGKIVFHDKRDYYEAGRSHICKQLLGLFIVITILGYLVILYLNLRVFAPFKELNLYTSEIAKGNFDIPLPIHKGNIFRSYTESFDMMRGELKRARENEYLANMSKKELVAELSHDIKTPIASIQATCEVIELKEKEQAILEKIKIIHRKSEVIHQLVENLFHATLEELEVLKVEPAEVSSKRVEEILEKARLYGIVTVTGTMPECLLEMDCLRFEQVVDNILNNSMKYAGTPIDITMEEKEGGVLFEIRDFGSGVPEEELALVTEKFYRGSNCEGKNGSGLGLYLASYFMEQMHGAMECMNANGFVVRLFVRKV